MADYPSTLGQEVGSRESWRDPMIADYARSGAVRGRRLQSAKKRVFQVDHRLLTEAQRAAFEAFYDANRNTTLTFKWNDSASTYTVIFADEDGPQWRRSKSLLWDLSVKLAEV